ncbi:hypothetical protein SAMN05216420_10423 [Nitrosospira sp. Nl5]|uniref:hypothetical protein n=1 Tax=Nitrosospira sp. Nl5 TaxID=200120 RepID=UPI00088D9CEB|nr:hypothetical protein [Nitrosospira sp. Nl5]SCY25971.1 hypothetical protein SAMN05216420_10423 [Nitrosospira sp. Nl5]
MGLRFSNFGKAVVSSAPSGTTGLSFTVEAGKGLLFPSLGTGDYFYGIFKDASGNREVVKIDTRSTDSLTIAAGGRGLDGTTARTWAAGDYFVAGLTNAALEESLSNANLAALGALSASADELPYFTGAGVAALTGLSSFIRALLDDADAATARATLGAAPLNIIPPGSVTDWFQAAAPVGWTQLTTHNDKALRIVSGAGGGSGGSVAFTAAFASQAVTGSNSATTLTSAQIPAHAHSGGMDTIVNTITGGPTSFFVHQNTQPLPYTGLTGGGGSHNHAFTGTAINLAVQYIDMILASKD